MSFGDEDGKAEKQSAAETAEGSTKIAALGTWQYMAPECWKRKFGEPGMPSDIFAFGLMLWEMLARMHIDTAQPLG